MSVSPLADAFLQRRELGHKHPVHDFLFTYYSCSPSKLKQWVPSLDESLTLNQDALIEHPWLAEPWFHVHNNTLSLDINRIHDAVKGLAKFISTLCSNILEKPPRFGCFGLHEWAMVYKLSPEDLRHKGLPLRLPQNELVDFVQSQTLCCSHYDAYRFFTPEAQPLNSLSPTLNTRLEMEQGGCIHANMDLYKWCIKLWPWVGSDLLGKAFMLAVEGREIDMRASPYNLKEFGYDPICIETEAGRREYQSEQQNYASRCIPLRRELHQFSKNLLQRTLA